MRCEAAALGGGRGRVCSWCRHDSSEGQEGQVGGGRASAVTVSGSESSRPSRSWLHAWFSLSFPHQGEAFPVPAVFRRLLGLQPGCSDPAGGEPGRSSSSRELSGTSRITSCQRAKSTGDGAKDTFWCTHACLDCLGRMS